MATPAVDRLGLSARAAVAAGGRRLVDWLDRPSADVHGYVSRPDLRPPVFDVREHAPELASGHVLVAPSSGPGQHGALMMQRSGSPIWFAPAAGGRSVMNFRVQRYRGEPVLTWWEGTISNGYGAGEYVIADGAYHTIARLRAGDGYAGDLHAFLITTEDTALVSVVRIVPADLSSIGGPVDGAVVDGGLQELDIATGRVLMHWSGLGRIALEESYKQPVSTPYDYLHLNSIDVGADGNLLVSGRHTWTLYRLDRGTGAILTHIGGKRRDLTVASGAEFAWQHDALWRDPNTITLFDDGARLLSRGLVLEVDESRVGLVDAYGHDPPLLATAEGSMHSLPNGDVLVGWGTEPWVTEFTAGGSATVTAGRELARVSRTGFETRIRLAGAPPYLRVSALDATGGVLGVSDLVETA